MADSGLVNRREGISLHDLQLLIRSKEGSRIVAAHSEAGLGQVIGAKAEELGGLGDLVGGDRSAGDLNHRANQVIQFYAFFLHDEARDAMDDLDLQVQLLLEAHQRNHDLGMHLDACFLNVGSRLKHCTRLHLGNLGMNNPQPTAPKTEHRIEFM